MEVVLHIIVGLHRRLRAIPLGVLLSGDLRPPARGDVILEGSLLPLPEGILELRRGK